MMNPSLSQQSGVVLMVSLMMLLLLSIIGVSGSQVTTLEEKMAGNSRDQNIAFQAAEAALRAGELVIENETDKTVFDTTPDNTNGLHLATEGLDYKAEATWAAAESVASADAGDSDAIPLVAAQPRFYIEYIGDKPSDPLYAGTPPGPDPISFFRVTARGTGRQNTTRVFLQSHFRKQF
jgi:type IV pilus assembly protein PilX